MDNILDRFGLYDFFGLLIPGMSFWVMLFYMDFPIIKSGSFPSSQTFRVIVFVLLSYIVGSLMQETASCFDNKCKKMRMRIKARENFLNTNPLFKGEELEEVKKIANKLLDKEKTNDNFSDDESYKLFNICKSYLENNNKMEKADKLDAIFAMSRDFIICNICVLCCLMITIFYVVIKKSFSWPLSYTVILIYTLASSIIFYRRAKRYSEMRTKTIIRQYMDLKRE